MAVNLNIKNPTISWRFDVYYGASYYKWSFKDENLVCGYEAYLIPDSFSGIKIMRSYSGTRIQTLGEMTFEVPNINNVLSASTFIGKDVNVHLYFDDGTSGEVIRTFKFCVKHCVNKYQKLCFTCEDRFTYKYFNSFFPLSKNINDVWRDDSQPPTKMCMPYPFGTPYIPIRSVYIGSSRYYVLGETAGIYTIDEVTSPRDFGSSSIWRSVDFDFLQYTYNTYRTFQMIIADSDADNIADANGLFPSGDKYLDVPTKYSRSDTVAKTNPGDVLKDILLSALGFEFSATTAISTFTSWSLAVNGAFHVRQELYKWVGKLLEHCHSTISYDISGNRVLTVLSKTSRQTASSTNILKRSFSYSPVDNNENFDSGKIAFYEDGKPQDTLYTYLVPLASATDNPTETILELPFAANNANTAKIGKLHFLRELNTVGKVNFIGNPSYIERNPEEVITFSGANYGAASSSGIIEDMHINRNFTVNITVKILDQALLDWADVSGVTLTVSEDDSSDFWSSIIAGPYAPTSEGYSPNTLLGDLILVGCLKSVVNPSSVGGIQICPDGIKAYKTTGDIFFDLDVPTETLTIRGAIVQSPSGDEFPVPCFRGAYDALTMYYKGDVVTYDSSTWIYINETPSVGNTPAAGVYWSLYAEGEVGETARSVTLSAVAQVFTYDTAGVNPSPGNTVVTAYARNTTGTIYYEFLVEGVSMQNTISNAYLYYAQGSFSNMPEIIEVRIREGAVDADVVANDMMTFFGLKEGHDGVTIVVSNEAHVIPCDENGTPTSYENSGTDIRAWIGATPIPYDDTVPYATPSFRIAATVSNIVAGTPSTVATYTRRYANASGMSADFASILYTITVVNAAGTSTNFQKTQSFSKASDGATGPAGVDGIDGADGADGAAGTNARAVNLTVNYQGFTYNTEGITPAPTSATVTATAMNTSGIVYYRFLKNDIAVQHSTSTTYTYSPQSSYVNMPDKIEVEIREDSTGAPVLARDQITMYGLRPGSNALTTILTNEAHTLPVSNLGTVTYDNSGTDIMIWEGTTQVRYATTGTYPRFSVVASGSNITPGAASTPSTYVRRYAVASAFGIAQQTGYIDFTISIYNTAGALTTIVRRQSFSQSAEGADGPGLTYRGAWVSTTAYVASQYVKDVVLYSGTYYTAKLNSTNILPTNTTYWTPFGASFSSVATDILLAQSVTITNTLTFTGGISKIIVTGSSGLEINSAGGVVVGNAADITLSGGSSSTNLSMIKWATQYNMCIAAYSNILQMWCSSNGLGGIYMGPKPSDINWKLGNLYVACASAGTIWLYVGSYGISISGTTIEITGNLLPFGTRTIGASGTRWNYAYLNYLNTLYTATIGTDLSIGGNLTLTGYVVSTLTPSGTRNLGTTSYRWASIFADVRLRLYNGAQSTDYVDILPTNASSTVNPAGAASGRIQVLINGVTRYIQLYIA